MSPLIVVVEISLQLHQAFFSSLWDLFSWSAVKDNGVHATTYLSLEDEERMRMAQICVVPLLCAFFKSNLCAL
jgi:hypothetical protein